MVKHKPGTSSISKNELSKIKFKPAKYNTISSVRTFAINEFNKELENNNTDCVENEVNFASDTDKNNQIIDIKTNNNNMEMIIPSQTSEVSDENTLRSAFKINIPTQNQFQVLENQEDNMEINDPTPPTNTASKPHEARASKPPPIVVHYKILSHSQLIRNLEKEATKGFYIKNTKNNTNIFINDPEEYKKYFELLEKEQISFHTYTEKSNKNHAFVLKGIDSKPDIDEIKMDLESKHLNIINIYKMKNTPRDMYLVITDKTVFLKHLSNKARYVCYTKVSWERHQTRNQVLQCRRCQKWGHATTNCRADPVCTKCGQLHWTKDCTQVYKDQAQTHCLIKCANCSGNHVAFSRECPLYKKRIELMEQRKDRTKNNGRKPTHPSNNKNSYVPAPLPRVNQWFKNSDSSIAPNNVQRSIIREGISHTNNQQETHTNFQSLVSEFGELNRLINLDNMIKLVRDINSQLRCCKNELEKFMKFNKFCMDNFLACETTAELPAYP